MSSLVSCASGMSGQRGSVCGFSAAPLCACSSLNRRDLSPLGAVAPAAGGTCEWLAADL